jgi:hypothetical protein
VAQPGGSFAASRRDIGRSRRFNIICHDWNKPGHDAQIRCRVRRPGCVVCFNRAGDSG